ncbi:hypothetical protein Droror1_Dr00021341 [Drosera rotundifolia]
MNRGDADIGINWAGGLHHAKKSEASGFCYVYDIVLGILEQLKVHRGAFWWFKVWSWFRVCSWFWVIGFGEGVGLGKHYSLNVSLNDGIDDDASFRGLFRPIITKVKEVYQPEAVVLQCGADLLTGDRLGCFNLPVKGHADCLAFLRSFNVPLMVFGGGGYTIRNVARCWCYETAVAAGVEPDNKLPNMENQNSAKDLERIRTMLLESLSRIPAAPTVAFQTTPITTDVPEEDEEDKDERPKPRIWNSEAYDSDPEDGKNSNQRAKDNVDTSAAADDAKKED